MSSRTDQKRRWKPGRVSRRGHIAAGSGLLAALLVVGAGGVGLAPLLGSSMESQDESGSPLDEISLDHESVPEPGDDVRVVLDGGESFVDGALEAATDEQVILRVSGLILPLDRSRVVSITVRLTPGQRYRDIRPTIRDDDVPRLLQLVRWLEQNRLYEEALRELEGILRQSPDNEEARRLVDLVNQLIVLERVRERRESQNRERERATPAERPTVKMPDRNRFDPLTPQQINLIKVYELNLQSRPRLLIDRSTYDELLKRYAEHPLIPVTREGKAEFYKKPAVEIMDIMFRVGARDLYGEVRVIGQPESMTTFRDQISARWLTNRCATTRCHGGSEAGRLKLLNRAPNSEATVYTNFLILDRFETRQPVPMIDYNNPSDSLLLQMALPREDVLYPHPEVKGWKPVFLSERSSQYRAAMDWMRMMYQPRPEYPIEYSTDGRRTDRPEEPEPDDPIER